jgi:hypothetical protein
MENKVYYSLVALGSFSEATELSRRNREFTNHKA